MRSSQRRKRERKVAHSPREVVGRLFVVEMMVVKLAVRVLVAEGRGEERERGEKSLIGSRNGGRLIFYQLWT
jgi:hypothetical protein